MSADWPPRQPWSYADMPKRQLKPADETQSFFQTEFDQKHYGATADTGYVGGPGTDSDLHHTIDPTRGMYSAPLPSHVSDHPQLGVATQHHHQQQPLQPMPHPHQTSHALQQHHAPQPQQTVQSQNAAPQAPQAPQPVAPKTPTQPNPKKRRAPGSAKPAANSQGGTAEAGPSGSPPKRSRTNTAWTQQEEQLLKQMRDQGATWSEIAKSFPSRTEGSVKKHWYKDMHWAEFGEEESAQLLAAIKEYDANKWKVIGQKLQKPAKACEAYAKEKFAGKL